MNGMFRLSRNVVFKADSGGAAGGGSAGGTGGAAGASGQGGEADAAPVTYEAWLAGQPENVKTLISGNEKNLKSALKTERDARSTLEGELRDAASKLEKGSEAEKKLLSTADQLSETSRRADFYEAAVAVGANNLKLAYLAAKEDDLFDKRGQCDFDKLKKAYPGLFGSGMQSNSAGEGTESETLKGKSMNTFIRRSAGREG